jgi:hypothetical protein
MKLLKASAPMLAALLLVGCHSGGAAWEPVVIDMSVTKTATPASATAKAAPAPTATPAPSPAATAVPTPVPTPPAPLPSPAAPPSPAARVAASRIDAFNRRDLEALAGLYASDAQVFDPPDRLRDSGRDQIRQTYARRFASTPQAKLSGDQRMAEGSFVVERETESGAEGRSQSAIVISEVREGKIVRVWILR